MVAILFVTMETGGLAEKSSIYFLLSMTYSTNWPDKISLTIQIKKKSHRAAVRLWWIDMIFWYIDMIFWYMDMIFWYIDMIVWYIL